MKLNKILGLGVLSFATLSFDLAYATPVKYAKCSESVKINHVPGGSGAFFNEDCTKIYVLPPKKGVMSISGYRSSPNIDLQCKRLREIEKDQLNLDKVASTQSDLLLSYYERIKEINENLQSGLIPAGKTEEELKTEIKNLTEEISKIRTETDVWQAKNDDKKLKFARAEGGRGTFLIENPYSELVTAYQKLNPDMMVERIVIDQSFLSINEEKYEESKAAQMPAVLNLKLIGVGEIPMLMDPSLVLSHKELVPMKAPDGSKIFSDALGGDIQVSNVGACALEKIGSVGENFSASDVKDYIKTSATYSYQVQVTRNYAIHLNLRELIKQIHEQTKKGGLFSRKTLNSFVDERRETEWIKFYFESGDTRFEYTDEQIKEIKGEFLDRALAQIISVKTGSPVALLALIDPSGKNGADEAGDALAKCPNVYCQIGAAGFKVLSAIFGSEKATSSMIKTFDLAHDEVSTEKRMVQQVGTYSFE